MPAERSFIDLLAAVRGGNDEAAAELVRRYEPAIRRWVHGKLTDSRLRRTLDTMDICQSVLGDFFARTALGQFDLESPEQLIKLLATMATNKVIDKARAATSAKRSNGELEVGGIEGLSVAGGGPTPSRIVSGREMLSLFRDRLSDEERRIFEQRSEGKSWAETAVALGSTADAVRMRWQRTIERSAVDLGLDSSVYA